MEETHTPDTDPPSFSSDSMAIPPPPPFGYSFYNSSSDQALLGNSISDLRFSIYGDGDFELTFDDLYFPSENESFLIPVDATNREISGGFTPVLGGISGDCVNDHMNTNCAVLPTDSDCSATGQSVSLSTADCVAHVSEATIVSSSSSPESVKVVVDQKLKVEEEEEEATTCKKSTTKRKKKNEDEDTSKESRSNKYMRTDEDGGDEEDDDEKRNARLIRNRESAQLSRQRKKHYVEELEDKVKNLHSLITDLNSKVSYFMAENATLREKVGPGKSMRWPRHQPPSPPGMYPPLAPMPYPWMPFPAYMVKPQGSQVVPLLPIPRLKPQRSVGKVKKSEAKTKKAVASVSVLGLLFCLFLFGALAPVVNYEGIGGGFYGEYDRLRGRVLDVSVNSTSRAHCGRDSDQRVGRNVSATENSVPLGNGREPLAASLFVPRDEKLVKLDGNLIIHSISASEKDMDFETKNEGESGVAATIKDLSPPALRLSDSKRTRDMSKHLNSERREALASSGSDDSKGKLNSTTTTANGEMQEWFREGVAGPMFSSGMCTEVFQFDVSSTSGAIIPASPATQQSKTTTDTHKGKNYRRILRGGLPVSDFNLTKDQNSSNKDNLGATKPFPSMVVSVLVDPGEGSDGDIEGITRGTKSLSRVFIVVLVDGVKYVTYSCVLPRPEVHLMTI